MPLRPPPRAPVPPPCWWELLGAWLHLSAPQAVRLWSLVSTSRDPTIRAWRLTVTYAHAARHDRSAATAFLTGPLRPTRVVEILERLVTDTKLTRREANAMEEAILAQTTAAGLWT